MVNPRVVVDNLAPPAMKKAIQERRSARSRVMSPRGTSEEVKGDFVSDSARQTFIPMMPLGPVLDQALTLRRLEPRFFGNLAIALTAIIAIGVNAIFQGAPCRTHWSWNFWAVARDNPLLFVITALLGLATVTSLVFLLVSWNSLPRICIPVASA
jgi:hypothetical protein